MLRDVEMKGEKHHFFIETNAEPEVLESILQDYKQEVQKISPGGFLRFIRRYGYRVDEMISLMFEPDQVLAFNPLAKETVLG